RASGAAYIVVIDQNGIRWSHTNPLLVGKWIGRPLPTRDGRAHLGIDNGTLGRSANAKVPLYGPTGTLVGEVSAGILESQVTGALWRTLPAFALWAALALALGA